ATSAKATQTD
nr:Chain C, Protein swallow 10-resiude peptide [synthetic construct]